jgi:subtilisin family serine protease
MRGRDERALLEGSGVEIPARMFGDPAESMPAPSVPGQMLVKLRDGGDWFNVPPLEAARAMSRMGPLRATESLGGLKWLYRVEETRPVFPTLAGEKQTPRVAEAEASLAGTASDVPGAGQAKRDELSRWYEFTLPKETDLDTALAAFASVPEVEYVEPNYEWRLAYEIPPVIEGLPDASTDPAYDEQWFHTNAGIAKAWDYLNHNGVYPGGTQDVVVAVIDSGVDYHHEDLAANMWVNPNEIPGNGIDDDHNGFVDDVHGASVVSNPSLHTGDPIDYHGHGTHVAGIIAAQGFNQRGGVGVAFNTRIMAIRAAQYSGTLTVDDVAEGILYAVDNGAEVINMSFGGYQRSQIIQEALEVALNTAVLVAAAGNDGLHISEAPLYPAALPWVLGVEASTPNDKLAWFSNFGYDVRAPGVSIFSTLPGNQYAAWSGTSMATPVVSGVAALMRAYFWQRDVWSSRFIMGSISASSYDPETGRATGVVDAYRALTEPPKPGVSMYQNWLFDDATIDAGNDEDGRADAGETIELAIELINRSGQADNVVATLEAREDAAVFPDPYVTISTDTVSFGSIGPFALADNGLVWNDQGVITGVQRPFVVTIDPSCPNDHVIPFVLTVTFVDGWDPERPTYTRVDRFELIVQRGRNLPSVISQDTVLTDDQFWIVGGPVLVEPGRSPLISQTPSER